VVNNIVVTMKDACSNDLVPYHLIDLVPAHPVDLVPANLVELVPAHLVDLAERPSNKSVVVVVV